MRHTLTGTIQHKVKQVTHNILFINMRKRSHLSFRDYSLFELCCSGGELLYEVMKTSKPKCRNETTHRETCVLASYPAKMKECLFFHCKTPFLFFYAVTFSIKPYSRIAVPLFPFWKLCVPCIIPFLLFCQL